MAFSQVNTSSSYKKSFISNVLKQIPAELLISETSVLISKCHILGCITGIKKFHQRTVFTVDDGTGKLDCILWHKESNIIEKTHELKRDVKFGNVALTNDIKDCALSLLEKADVSALIEADKYDHGDIISCLGNVRIYKGNLQLEIHHHYGSTSADSESLWILDVLDTQQRKNNML